jgi:hypothetical protein
LKGAVPFGLKVLVEMGYQLERFSLTSMMMDVLAGPAIRHSK